jgi:hypothetical protein
MKEVRVMKDLEFIKLAREEIFELMKRLDIPVTNSSFSVGKFVLSIAPLGRTFGFWIVGEKEIKHSWISDKAGSLSVTTPGRETMVSGNRVSTIEEFVGIDSEYPNIEFEWIGFNKSKDVKKGALTYVRIDLSDTHYANYKKENVGKGFLSFNSIEGDLSISNLPEKLEGALEILGEAFNQKIDYDEKVDEIISNSGLEEFLKELRLLANRKPSISRD